MGTSNKSFTCPSCSAFFESAVLKVGDDVLQVDSFGSFAVNGVRDAETPFFMNNGHIKVTHTQKDKKSHAFKIQLNAVEYFQIRTFKDMITVDMNAMPGSIVEGSMGLLGNSKGEKVGRDGAVMEDDNSFAEEWQVLDSEPMLFESVREPQHPAKCVLPSAEASAQKTRRLGEASQLKSAAEQACAKYQKPESIERCVYDVLAVEDLDIAAAGTY